MPYIYLPIYICIYLYQGKKILFTLPPYKGVRITHKSDTPEDPSGPSTQLSIYAMQGNVFVFLHVSEIPIRHIFAESVQSFRSALQSQ